MYFVKRKAKFSKHNAGIIFLDFSKCSKYMQTCCRAYELLFSRYAFFLKRLSTVVLLHPISLNLQYRYGEHDSGWSYKVHI